MGNPTLVTLTGDPLLDGLLRGIIGSLELVLPGRIRAVYLTGSAADGTAVFRPDDRFNSSDIDLWIVFQERYTPEDAARFAQWLQACTALCAVRLDAYAIGEDQLFTAGLTIITSASTLIHGVDVRARIPRAPFTDHLQRALTFPPYLLALLRRQAEPHLIFPLTYPDPAGAYYGYDVADERYGNRPGTAVLVAAVCWAATVILAITARRYAGTKRDAIRRYREVIGDEWSVFAERVYTQCKVTWQYGIPAHEDERRELRALCAHMLAFENHLLGCYRDFLLGELEQGVEADRLAAVKLLRMVIYPDPAIRQALRRLVGSPIPELQRATDEALAKLEQARRAG